MDQLFDVIALIALEWRDVALGHKEYSLSLFALAFLIGGLFFSLIKAVKISALNQQIKNKEQALQEAEVKQQQLLTQTNEQKTQIQSIQQDLEQKQNELETAHQSHSNVLANKEQTYHQSIQAKQKEIDDLNTVLNNKTEFTDQLQQKLDRQTSDLAGLKKQIDAFNAKEEQLLTAHVDLRRQLETLQNDNILLQSRYQEQIQLAEMHQSKQNQLQQQLDDLKKTAITNQTIQAPEVSAIDPQEEPVSIAIEPEEINLELSIEPSDSDSTTEIQIESPDFEPTETKADSYEESLQTIEIDENLTTDEQPIPEVSSDLNDLSIHQIDDEKNTLNEPDPVDTIKTAPITVSEEIPENTPDVPPVTETTPQKPQASTTKNKLGGVMSWFSSLDNKLGQAGLAEYDRQATPSEDEPPEPAITQSPETNTIPTPEPEIRQETIPDPSLAEPEKQIAPYASDISFSERLADMADTMDAMQGKIKGLFKRKK